MGLSRTLNNLLRLYMVYISTYKKFLPRSNCDMKTLNFFSLLADEKRQKKVFTVCIHQD